MSTGRWVASEGCNLKTDSGASGAGFCFSSSMKYRNHFDTIAGRLLSQRGIAAVWELHVKAAAAYRRGNWLSAAGLVTIADAAERLWRSRNRH
jgi:hypothetical protein